MFLPLHVSWVIMRAARPSHLVFSIFYGVGDEWMFMKHYCSGMTLPEGKPIYSAENLAQWHILHQKPMRNGLRLNSRLRLRGRWLTSWVLAQPRYHHHLLNEPNNSVRPVPVAVRSKAWVCGRSSGLESRRWRGCLSLVRMVCCQVEVYSGRSLVQGSPTECVCVTVWWSATVTLYTYSE
jgi:hypothetical protein